MRSIIRLTFLILCLSFTDTAFAQTFKITDMQFGPDVSEYGKSQAFEMLGKMLTIEDYGNYIRVRLNAEKAEPFILEKQNGNSYKFSTKGNTSVTITIEKTLGYWSGAKMESRKSGKLYFIATLKRCIV